MSKPASIAEALRMTIGSREHVLDLACAACGGRSVMYPLRLLGERWGAEMTLAEVLRRIRCKHCRKAPTQVVLQEHTGRAAMGGTYGWSLQLVPPEEP